MYKSLRDVVKDLESHKKLVRIKTQVSGNLEAAEIHRRIFDAKGPAILFENIEGSPFQAMSNIYGTYERTDFLFRKTMDKVKKVIEIKADPTRLLKNPLRYLGAPFTALTALPRKSFFTPPITYGKTTISKLPLIKSWPMDGGAFVTLPQVCTLPPNTKSVMKSNIGMYRIQLNGNDYETDKEIGLHYQLHRGIGNHHQMYNNSEEDFKCSVFIGGPPSHAFSAIMPLPENLSEVTFAGLLGGRAFRYHFDELGFLLSCDADFVITGTVVKDETKSEGPFGDHLGYYSLAHQFPYMKVSNVYHKKDPIWQFSVVGRPPQEDSSFGYLIHQLVKELTGGEFPGLNSIHAVDAAGVHPLLLAVGQERYMPFRDRKPEEILTIANRIIGSGQTSLAKYLIIAAQDDDLSLDAHHIEDMFDHVLSRVDWRRDLHFQTNTTIDTLDYSGDGWNTGSKLVIACRGEKLRNLGTELPSISSNDTIKYCKIARPGVLAIQPNKWVSYEQSQREVNDLANFLKTWNLKEFPLIVLCDDADFLEKTLNNFLWVTFTRSNPSHDVYGIDSFYQNKHWGCKGSLIIDARLKKHHAPELVIDQAVSKKVDQLFSKGGELYGVV
jgi:4-hydroxy-3-polyprenylbenzoate decarboxylase